MSQFTMPNRGIIERIAKTAHEVNRAYCASLGEEPMPAWADAPRWQRDSAINGVQFHIDHPDAGPAESHDSWLLQKLRSGWRYGAHKDAGLKTHPCMVPYDKLPAEQRVKDALFVAVVRSLVE